MAKPTYKLTALLAVAALSSALAQPAWAQGGDPYNMKHFYMARQQIQITDDAPMINDQRTNPTGQIPGRPMGAMNRPMALPRAGFNSYAPPPTMPAFNTSLPRVENGVPPKEALEQPVRRGNSAKAGKLKPTKAATQTAKTPTKAPVTAAKAYSPYKGYNPQAAAAAQNAGTAGTNAMQSQTKVRGSVLHWARGR